MVAVCPVTDAVFQFFDDPEEERGLLEHLQNDFMFTNSHRTAEVESYFEIAPDLVKQLEEDPFRNSVYRVMMENYLAPAASLIREGLYDEAYSVYKKGLAFLVTFLHS